jgi:hypothetical protein
MLHWRLHLRKDLDMSNVQKYLTTILFLTTVIWGCSAPLPVPFQLVDSSNKVQFGTLFPDTQQIQVMVNGHLFNGFFIVAGGGAVSQTLSGRRYLPSESVTTYSSNSARAHLTADNGQQLNCEFLYELRRAIGECRSPAGVVFQLTADDNVSKSK